MKIRKQVRLLYKNLCVEVNAAIASHNCTAFLNNPTNGVCMLCLMLRNRRIFAAIHLARQFKLHTEWFDTERTLYDLLGEKAFFNKIEIELKEVANYPKKECPACGTVVVFFVPFKKLIRSKKRGIREAPCHHCGHQVNLVELPTLPFSKENDSPKEDEAPRLRPRGAAIRGIKPPMPPRHTIESIGEQVIIKQESTTSAGIAKIKTLVQQMGNAQQVSLVEGILNGDIPGRVYLNGVNEVIIEPE